MSVKFNTTFIEYDKNNVEDKQHKRLKDYYVCVDGNYISADNLFVYESDEKRSKIISYNQLVKNLNIVSKTKAVSSNVYTAEVGGELVPAQSKVYVKNLDVPKTFESVSINGGEGANKKVPLGLKRVVEMKSNANFLGEYIYLKLENDKDAQFINKNEVGFYDGLTFVSLNAVSSFEELEGKELVTTNYNVVEWLFSEGTFNAGKVVAREKLNLADGKKITYSLDKKGNTTVSEVELNKVIAYQVFGKEGDKKATLSTKVFKLGDGSGEFIHVKNEGETNLTPVKVKELFYVDKNNNLTTPIDAELFKTEDVFSLVGKKVGYKDSEGKAVITQPLTLEDVKLTYNIEKVLQPLTEEDIAYKDGTYLKLDDGRFVQENRSVRPHSYIYQNTENGCDAYLLKIKKDDSVEYKIIQNDEKKIRRAKSLNIVERIPLKINTSELAKSDVIQTSSNDNHAIEDCEILNEALKDDENNIVKTPKSKEEKDKILNNAKKQFIEDYTNNQYDVNYVVVGGKCEKLDEKHERYRYSDTFVSEDFSNEASEYKYLKNNPLNFDGEKLTGGPSFDVKAANKALFKKLGGALGIGIVLSLTGPGLLLMIALPAAVPFVLAGGAALAVAGPIVNGIKGLIINRKPNKFKDKLELHRKAKRKENVKELKKVEEELKVDNEREIALLQKFDELGKELIGTFSRSEYIAEFKMENGHGQVNDSNAYLYMLYLKEIKQLEKSIKQLEASAWMDKTGEKAKLLAQQKARLKAIKQNFVMKSSSTPNDKHLEDDVKKLEAAKGYMLAKYIHRGQFTEEEQTYIDNMEFNYETGTYHFKNLPKVNRNVKHKILDDKIVNLLGNVTYEYAAKKEAKDGIITEETSFDFNHDLSEEEKLFTKYLKVPRIIENFPVAYKQSLAKELRIDISELNALIDGVISKMQMVPEIVRDKKGNITAIYTNHVINGTLTKKEEQIFRSINVRQNIGKELIMHKPVLAQAITSKDDCKDIISKIDDKIKELCKKEFDESKHVLKTTAYAESDAMYEADKVETATYVSPDLEVTVAPEEVAPEAEVSEERTEKAEKATKVVKVLGLTISKTVVTKTLTGPDKVVKEEDKIVNIQFVKSSLEKFNELLDKVVKHDAILTDKFKGKVDVYIKQNVKRMKKKYSKGKESLGTEELELMEKIIEKYDTYVEGVAYTDDSGLIW